MFSFFLFFFPLFPSFDARGTSLHEAKHWWDTETLGDKAYFHYNTNPPALRIRNVHEAEAGLYKCRVDFKKNPTKNSRINLKVLGKYVMDGGEKSFSLGTVLITLFSFHPFVPFGPSCSVGVIFMDSG